MNGGKLICLSAQKELCAHTGYKAIIILSSLQSDVSDLQWPFHKGVWIVNIHCSYIGYTDWVAFLFVFNTANYMMFCSVATRLINISFRGWTWSLTEYNIRLINYISLVYLGSQCYQDIVTKNPCTFNANWAFSLQHECNNDWYYDNIK